MKDLLKGTALQTDKLKRHRCLVQCMQMLPCWLQVLVVNYEEAHTTMEAPDEDDEESSK